MNRRFLSLASAACMGILPACSMKIAHRDGSVTYLGVVNLREGTAGDLPLVHSRRVGMMLDAGLSANGFALGYDDRVVVKPPGETVTLVDYQVGQDPKVKMIRPH